MFCLKMHNHDADILSKNGASRDEACHPLDQIPNHAEFVFLDRVNWQFYRKPKVFYKTPSLRYKDT